MPIVLDPIPTPDQPQVFGLRAGVEQKGGVRNLKEYVFLGDTNEDPTADPEPASIAPAITDKLVESATLMHGAWREYLESKRVPGQAALAVPLGYSNAAEQRALADLNENGALVFAWAGRNIDSDDTRPVPQQVGTAMRKWEEGLERLRTGKMLLDYQTANDIIGPDGDDDDWGQVDAPVSAVATVDADGRTITNPPTGSYWDGGSGRWRW